jgi:hypothetical protein
VETELNMDPSTSAALGVRMTDWGYLSEQMWEGLHFSEREKQGVFPLNHGEPGAPYPTLSKEEKKRNILF